jgi:hypothetical protein
MRMISYDAQGNVVSDQTTPATTDEVTAERDRRIDDSFVFNGVSYQCRAADRENIAGAAQLAFMAKVTGQPFSLQWIAEDNSTVTMDADAVIAFASAAAQKKSALIFAARALKDRIAAGEVIADCADPSYWPA